MMKPQVLLTLLSFLSSLILIILFLVLRKKNQEKKLWVIFFYVISSLSSDIMLQIFSDANIYSVERYYIYCCFTVIEYTIISWFFYVTILTKNIKRFILACYPIFYIIAVYVYLNPPLNYEFDSLLASSEGILVIIFTITYLYEQINSSQTTVVYENKDFWIIIAFLFYLSATIFLFNKAVTLEDKSRQASWSINDLANIIKNVLFFIAFNMPAQKTVNQTRKYPG